MNDRYGVKDEKIKHNPFFKTVRDLKRSKRASTLGRVMTDDVMYNRIYNNILMELKFPSLAVKSLFVKMKGGAPKESKSKSNQSLIPRESDKDISKPVTWKNVKGAN